ncbi:MAG: hypothetical protein KR126chlam1_00744 [Chlamydiae bacterium]|nr:hypothetical protein [Chlamydiota bacterium]
MSPLKNLPTSELPRERLLRDGVQALSIQELIAILLGTGTKGKTVLSLAQDLLIHFGGMEGLINASVEELIEMKGIGKAKAILLKAAFGIASRASKEKRVVENKVTTIDDVVAIAEPEIGDLQQEALLVILRDVKSCLIHAEVISLGTLSEVLVHPREVFRPALRHGAYSLIICHNHPSGDPTPSDADIRLTKQLLESSRIMGIPLVDHIIIGKGKHHSMRRSSIWEA